MSFTKTTLREEIVIKKLVTVHYFEHANNYVFDGEQHDFWELLYVDKGEVEVMANTEGYKLKQGEMIFHQPNEFHNVWANGKVAPNLVVISFECKSQAINFFKNRILKINDNEHYLLANFIKEASQAFLPPFNDPSTTQLMKRSDGLFASEQLLKIYLEQLLILLMRNHTLQLAESRLSLITKERSDKELTQKLIKYLIDNTQRNIRFKDIIEFSKLSSTHVKLLFKAETDMSAMEYFRKLKIEKAKKLIREENLTFTEIATLLGYDSIHYFSRQFKKITGMSPSEYAYSIQARI